MDQDYQNEPKVSVARHNKATTQSVSTKTSLQAIHLNKRAIAPYINMVQKGQKLIVKSTTTNAYSFFMTKKSSALMRNLSVFISSSKELPELLYETGGILKTLSKSLGMRLYFVDKSTKQLFQYQKNVTYPRCRVNYQIETDNSVPAYVARTQQYVLVDDVTKDDRFPDAVHYKVYLIQIEIIMEDSELEKADDFRSIHKVIVATKSTMSSRSVKRALAPYINLFPKAQQSMIKNTPNIKYGYFMSKKPSMLVKTLSVLIHDHKDTPDLMYETGQILQSLTNSLGVRVYFVEKTTNQLYQYQKNITYPRCRVNYDIDNDQSVVSYVARNKEYVVVNDVTTDSRFPDGIHYKDNVKPVLCMPIVAKNECYAVYEFYRERTEAPYSKYDLKVAVLVCGWVGLAIQQNMEGVILHKTQEINETLLHLILAYFAETITIEEVFAEFVNFAKKQLKAEKGAFYIIFNDPTTGEQLADVYEEGISDVDHLLIKKKLRVKFSKEPTVVNLVLKTKQMVNVRDAYNDPRFNREIVRDNNLMVINRTELCTPIMAYGKLLGIMSLTNKEHGLFFTDDDETLLNVIATYSCLILHHSSALQVISRSKLEAEQIIKLMRYYMAPCERDVVEMIEPCYIPKNIKDWYILPEEISLMPRMYIYMIKELIPEDCIDFDQLYRFTLTVAKGYRDNPYHNFEHAFNVTHCMFAILTRNKEQFSLIELEAFMTATLCHDIDHLGYTNNFLRITNHPLSQLYDESPFENHHVFVTLNILAKYTMYTNISSESQQQYLDLVSQHILDTDLVCYFRARLKLIPLIQDDSFNISIPEHKFLASAIMMTTCDLSGQFKPFSITKRMTDKVYEEFYHQGDLEKERGITPLPTMNRDNQYLVPEDQVQFLTIVVMTCIELLALVLPNIAEIYGNAVLMRDTWQQIINSKGDKLWRQCDSII